MGKSIEQNKKVYVMKLASKRIFDKFGEYFPYSTVDVVIRKNGSFLLTKRNIAPYRSKWHLPGGIIHKGEKMQTVAKKVIKKELQLEVRLEKFLGVYENPISTRHDISHVFVATVLRGNLKNDFQSTEVKFFKRLPRNIIPYHHKIISDARSFLK